MKHTRSRRVIRAIQSLCLAPLWLAACSSGSGSGVPTGGGARCDSACQKMASAHCPGASQQDCLNGCRNPSICTSDGNTTQCSPVPSNCAANFQALVQCADDKGSFVCDGDGDAQLQGCDAAEKAYLQCVYGSTGGVDPAPGA